MKVLDRSKAPAFQIPEHIQLTQPSKQVLQNGIAIYFIPTPAIDAVKLEVITDSNKHLLPEGKALVPFFTLHMLQEGTTSHSSDEIDNFFDHYASEVDVISSFEQSGLSLLTTKKHFSTVLPMFRALFTEATLPEKELEKRKSQKSLTISLHKEQTSARANQLYRKALFGTEHPYGFVAEESDVDAVLPEDLKAYYREHFLVNPEIFVTGNLSDGQIDEIMDYFGNLPVLTSANTLPDFTIWPEKRLVETKDKSLQSSIRLGQHLIPKTHPDYHALTVFNTILGGYFGSRLIRNIREDKGHTYGIYSSMGSLRLSDYWVVMADVQKGFADEVIQEVYKEIEILKTSPIGHDELEIVRNYMIGHFLSSFSSAFDLISRFKSIHQAGLDYSFYEDQLAYFRNFSPEDVIRVGQLYFDNEGILEVIVG